MAAVRLVGVTKTYPDGFEAVRTLDLSIEDGELHVLLGPSGCGKTSVLRMIAGLEDVSSGDILLDGERINDVAPRDRDMAMAFQAHALYPHLTVAENIGFPLKMIGLHADVVTRRVRETARLLHLDTVLERRPRQLSGGQQQRVSLGRSIIRNPRVFLMDEPLSNLDSDLRIESRTEIMRIQRQIGATTIFVTHDQIEAMSMADRVTLLRDGRVVQCGPPAEVYADPVDLFAARFMGSPPMSVVVATVVRSPSSGRLALDVGSQTVPIDRVGRPTSSTHLGEGMRVAVGMRPESLHRDDDGPLVASVESSESLGSVRLVHASIAAPSVTATADGVEIGDSHRSPIMAYVPAHDPVGRFAPFTLQIDRGSLHLFDLETGRTLAAPGVASTGNRERGRTQPLARPV